MSRVKTAAFAVLFGLVGVLLGLGVWRAYSDYTDFLKIRVWVGQMQQLQADQAKAQQQRQAPSEPAK